MTTHQYTPLLRQAYESNRFLELVHALVPQDTLTYQNEILTDLTDYDYFDKVILHERSQASEWGRGFGVVSVQLQNSTTSRVKLTKDIFRLFTAHSLSAGLVAVYHPEESSWRLSLVESGIRRVDGQLRRVFSNPRRFSYYLGLDAPIQTPARHLKLGEIAPDLPHLKQRFDIQVVTKEFFDEIQKRYEQLHQSLSVHVEEEAFEPRDFALRVIGRLLFVWFLREKQWINAEVINPEYLARAEGASENYYRRYLQPLFFEVLNRPRAERSGEIARLFASTPYLNGGLFRRHAFEAGDEVQVSNEQIQAILELFSRYHFTVDENTPADQELGVDPEMIGKIFENFVLERSETGSFYTPREIVDYMVESSLLELLAQRYHVSPLGVGEYAQLLEREDYTLLRYLETYPHQKILYRDTVLQTHISTTVYLLAKLKGYRVDSPQARTFRTQGHRHPEVTASILEKYLASQYEVHSTFVVKPKVVEGVWLPKIGQHLRIGEQDLVVIYSISLGGYLLLDTIHGTVPKKVAKLQAQSQENLEEFLRHIPNESLRDRARQWLTRYTYKNSPVGGQAKAKISSNSRHRDGDSPDCDQHRWLPDEFSNFCQEYASSVNNSDSLVKIGIRDRLYQWVQNFKINQRAEKVEDKCREVTRYLDQLKIIDPACGSGAFPMGVLQKMVDLYGYLGDTRSDYQLKIHILSNSIYGVDILEIATEISRLRAWLSLVVDEDATDPQPLPNLEFKFATANSLIQLDLPEIKDANSPQQVQDSVFEHLNSPLSQTQLDLHENKADTILEMRTVMAEWFGASAEERVRLRRRYATNSRNLLSLYQQSNSSNQDLLKLASHDPFATKSKEFFDPQWMFGVDQFDLVIGNPPYVGEKGHKELFAPLKTSPLGRRFYRGKMDLHYFFFHLGLDLLKPHGFLSYITTNYYITATAGDKLRADLRARSDLRTLVNFGEIKIFKSAEGQHNLITMLSKKHPTKPVPVPARTVVTRRKGYLGEKVLKDIVEKEDKQTEYYTIPQEKLFDANGYLKLTHSLTDETLEKMIENSEMLGDICGISNGIHTQADYLSKKKYHLRNNLEKQIGDGIYVLSAENKSDKKVRLTFNEDEINNYLRPFYKNSDVQQYVSNLETNQEIIYLNKQKHDIGELPNIKEHLLGFETLITKASDNAPYLHRPKAIPFEGPKIVAPQRSPRNTFGYNEVSWYASADVYFITQPEEGYSLKFLLGVLNSRLIYKWLYYRGKRKGEMLELYQKPLSQIPIPTLDIPEQEELAKQVEELTDRIIAAKQTDPEANTADLERDIDELVYRLYHLTPEDIEIIEGK